MIRSRSLAWLCLFGIIVLALLIWTLRPIGDQRSGKKRIVLSDVLGSQEDESYQRALVIKEFSFPQDHGPHPRFKTEWWYYTGNLSSDQGRRFGYQLTFFRIAISPEPLQRTSNWATNQVYMAHFAITDPDVERFYNFERFSRAALGLAGASAQPFRVWLEDWVADAADPSGLPMRLLASTSNVSIDLLLNSAKPVVLQGQNGLSQKSAQPGNASYYYSLTRMPTVGTIRVENQTFEVSGNSWLDREWSTSVLGEDQVGWDWFSLQMDDGRDLMYYQLRRKDGSIDPLSSGILVEPDGLTHRFSSADIHLEVLESWLSAQSGVRYPAKWRLQIKKRGLDLTIAPLLADQELETSVRYWEGAVAISGTENGHELNGHGYVELTGY